MKVILISIIPYILITLLINPLQAQFTILSPSDLIEIMKQTQSNAAYKLGNFGEIPYGKTIVGNIHYEKSQDNTWCDIDKTPQSFDVLGGDIDYTPIFLVDHGNCSYTKKAYNARARGARVMLLVSDDETFHDEMNVDDKLGERIDIPTIIITNSNGQTIKRYIENNPISKVIVSAKFISLQGDNITVELYMRSDDPKALHFFKEFQSFYELLKNKINFIPVYKYYKYGWLESNDKPSTLDNNAGCIKNGAYCGTDNEKMRISNPRIILLENIRQSCIYKLHTNDITPYWNYMIQFSDTCGDLNNPIFTEECAKNIINYVGLSNLDIDRCIETEIKNRGVVEIDSEKFEKNKVYKIPQVLINGVKYKGSWYSKYIFDAICTGFMEDNTICNIKESKTVIESGYGYGTIFLIFLIITMIMLIVLYCYRRVVNRQLEQSLNEKIQTQTIFSLGQYQVFKDDTGRKSVDVTKL